MTVHSTSSESSDLDPSLLERYWLGEVSPAERAAVEAWFVAHPKWKERYDELRHGLTAGNWTPLSQNDIDRMVASSRAMLAAQNGQSQEQTGHVPSSRKQSPQSPRKWYPAAIAGVCAVAIGLGMWTITSSQVPEARATTYATQPGERAILTLPDGSQVVLAPQTQVSIPDYFGAGARTVELKGNAYFDVTTVAGAPFTVTTGTIETRVLGTQFDISHFADDPAVRVAVVSGRVMAGNATVEANTIAYVTDSSVALMKSEDMAPFTEWTTGTLVFRDTSVAAMLDAVGRWFGYEFRIADSTLAQRRVMASFRTDDPSNTLHLIQHLLSVSMTVEDSVVIVTPRGSARKGLPKRESHTQFSTPWEVGK